MLAITVGEGRQFEAWKREPSFVHQFSTELLATIAAAVLGILASMIIAGHLPMPRAGFSPSTASVQARVIEVQSPLVLRGSVETSKAPRESK